MPDHTLAMPTITYEYRFAFDDGNRKNFTVQIDGNSLLLIPQSIRPTTWSKLSCNQCTCCPLSSSTTTDCPIALNLSELVSAFTDVVSYKACHVTCVTAERIVSKQTNVQDGLSSIMGLIMATSGCPVLDILKPMARFHLPFATIEEAIFRSISVYLLRQYFIDLQKKESDFQLEKVKTRYREIELVNNGMVKRIKSASKLDADNNAIIILNCLSQLLQLELEDNLQSLQPIFAEQ